MPEPPADGAADAATPGDSAAPPDPDGAADAATPGDSAAPLDADSRPCPVPGCSILTTPAEGTSFLVADDTHVYLGLDTIERIPRQAGETRPLPSRVYQPTQPVPPLIAGGYLYLLGRDDAGDLALARIPVEGGEEEVRATDPTEDAVATFLCASESHILWGSQAPQPGAPIRVYASSVEGNGEAVAHLDWAASGNEPRLLLPGGGAGAAHVYLFTEQSTGVALSRVLLPPSSPTTSPATVRPPGPWNRVDLGTAFDIVYWTDPMLPQVFWRDLRDGIVDPPLRFVRGVAAPADRLLVDGSAFLYYRANGVAIGRAPIEQDQPEPQTLVEVGGSARIDRLAVHSGQLFYSILEEGVVHVRVVDL